MKKFLSVLLAASMAASMSVTAFAAIQSDFQSGYDVHRQAVVHYADGRDIAGVTQNEEENKSYEALYKRVKFDPSVYGTPYCAGVINVKVGETVKMHMRQNNYELSLMDSPSNPAKIVDYYGSMGYFSNDKGAFISIDVPGGEDKADWPSLLVNGYCLPVNITGLQNSTSIFLINQNPLALSYYKVVVGTGVDTIGGTSDIKKAPAKTEAEKTETAKTEAEKPEAAKTETAKTETAKTEAQKPQTVVSTGVSLTNEVKLGETFATMALNYYGDMACWPAIYKVNADAIAAAPDKKIYDGMALTIPAAVTHKGETIYAIAPAAAGAGEKLYTVKAGDTYGSIAQAHFGNMSRYNEIFSRNSDRLKDIKTLFEGQIIVLPAK